MKGHRRREQLGEIPWSKIAPGAPELEQVRATVRRHQRLPTSGYDMASGEHVGIFTAKRELYRDTIAALTIWMNADHLRLTSPKVMSWMRELVDFCGRYEVKGPAVLEGLKRAVKQFDGESLKPVKRYGAETVTAFFLSENDKPATGASARLIDWLREIVAYCDEYGAAGADVLAGFRLAVERYFSAQERGGLSWQDGLEDPAEQRRRVLEQTAHLRIRGRASADPSARRPV